MPANALTRLDPDTAVPNPPAMPPPLMTPWVVLVVHRIGTEGPWWADAHSVEADGTLGWIEHSGAFSSTREGAVEAARQGLARQAVSKSAASFSAAPML